MHKSECILFRLDSGRPEHAEKGSAGRSWRSTLHRGEARPRDASRAPAAQGIWLRLCSLYRRLGGVREEPGPPVLEHSGACDL